jgi:hypothetical protein
MRRLLIAMLVCATVACGGGSDESKEAAAASDAGASSSGAPAGVQTPEQAAAAAQQMLGQMAQQQAKVVDYTLLKPLVPELSGWKRSDPKGETVSMGMSISTVKADYEKDDSSLHLEITDTAFTQALILPFRMAASYSQRSDDGYKQGVTISGAPGWEEWRKEGGYGEVGLLVGDRFMVNVKGNNLANIDPAKQLAQAIDFGKLASLK